MDKVIGAFKKVGEAFSALAGAGLALISAAVVLQVLFGAAVRVGGAWRSARSV